MKLSKRIKILILTYFWVFPMLFGLVYLSIFARQSEFIDSTILGFNSIDITQVQHLQLLHLMILMSVVSIIPTIYFLRTKVKRAAAFVAATASFLLIVTIGVAVIGKIIVPLLYLELSLFLGTAVAIILKMIFASSEQEFLRLAFSQFVSEQMLKELLKNPDKLKLQGKESEVTVMFIDIRGFTTFSEKNSPVLVVNRLNDLLDKVTHLILAHHGTVDKYMGDAVMAFWGAPSTDKKQASNACAAAIDIRNKIESETEFRVGIGINTGMAIVGNMGSSRRFDYTVIGDTVNTAARLESATKEVGKPIVIADSVVQKLTQEKARFTTHDLGLIMVKGKNQGIHVHALT